MPIYTYNCKNGHEFDRMLKFTEIDKRVRCPECKTAGKRKLIQDFADRNSTKERSNNSKALTRKRFTNW